MLILVLTPFGLQKYLGTGIKRLFRKNVFTCVFNYTVDIVDRPINRERKDLRCIECRPIVRISPNDFLKRSVLICFRNSIMDKSYTLCKPFLKAGCIAADCIDHGPQGMRRDADTNVFPNQVYIHFRGPLIGSLLQATVNI